MTLAPGSVPFENRNQDTASMSRKVFKHLGLKPEASATEKTVETRTPGAQTESLWLCT